MALQLNTAPTPSPAWSICDCAKRREGGGSDVTYGWRDTNFDVRTAPVTQGGATWSGATGVVA
jgi:hypothetical protein